MNKMKCSCGETWFGYKEDNEYHISDNADDGKTHKISIVRNLSAEDYAELWSSDLENANRHSISEMPNDVLSILKKNIKDKETITKIMKSMYNKEIGL